jgi:phosphotriesterase-related protein
MTQAQQADEPQQANQSQQVDEPQQVQTALGLVETSRLGRVLMHEHVFVVTADVQQNYPEEWGDEDARVAEAVRRLSELPEHGISTIVDVTVVGQGRDIKRLTRIAEQVPDLNIVVATGIYTFDEVPLFFSRRPSSTMSDYFIRDITEGITGTNIKAGMLKCAIDEKGLTKGTERVLRAVARAHRETGTPITIHTHAAGMHGRAILSVLTDEGADLSRVVLGHSGDSEDPDYLEEMAATGLVLGMDRFGIDSVAGFEQRCDLVVDMCRRGFAGQLVLSHDCSVYLDWFAPGRLDNLKNWHYLHVSNDVLPYLRDHEVTEDQIDEMLVRTPARVLGPAGGA